MKSNIHDPERIFILKSILGRSVDAFNPASVIRACISKAYSDMNTVGRFYNNNRDKADFVGECLKTFENRKYEFSRELIEEISCLFGEEEIIKSNRGYVTTYGLSQKLVNMTYKYLYIFRQYTEREIDFSNCDCPIDSNVLKELGITDIVWSKLERSRYEKIQDDIHKLLSNDKLYADHIVGVGNLAFDFFCW